jgi:hypothetical protein
LREVYTQTWQELSQALTQLQQLNAAQDRDYPKIEAALAEVQTARAKHNEARDRLADALNVAQSPGSEITVQVRYASSSVSSMEAPAKTKPSLITRA